MRRTLNNMNVKEENMSNKQKGSDFMKKTMVDKRLVKQTGRMVPNVTWPFYLGELLVVLIALIVGMVIAALTGNLRRLVEVTGGAVGVMLALDVGIWLLRGWLAHRHGVRWGVSWWQTQRLRVKLRGSWRTEMSADLVCAIKHCRIINYRNGQTLCLIPDNLGLMTQHAADRLDFSNQVMRQLVSQLRGTHSEWYPVAHTDYQCCWFYPLTR
ncbi:hypothetical protein ACLHIM_00045 [Ligilactobacillus sp. LYQ112]|uniref:hypothetical protein n=1 Tax=Ligilactobacillus sp. LYQ112 TaxID=3391060 RepID=UPI003983C243